MAHDKDYKFDLEEDNYDIMYQMSPRAFQEMRDAMDSTCSSVESISQGNSSTLGSSRYQDNSSASDTSSISDSEATRKPVIEKKMSILLSKDGRSSESDCEVAEGVARALAFNKLGKRSGMSPEQESASLVRSLSLLF